jgi:hypothetical protein
MVPEVAAVPPPAPHAARIGHGEPAQAHACPDDQLAAGQLLCKWIRGDAIVHEGSSLHR